MNDTAAYKNFTGKAILFGNQALIAEPRELKVRYMYKPEDSLHREQGFVIIPMEYIGEDGRPMFDAGNAKYVVVNEQVAAAITLVDIANYSSAKGDSSTRNAVETIGGFVAPNVRQRLFGRDDVEVVFMPYNMDPLKPFFAHSYRPPKAGLT